MTRSRTRSTSTSGTANSTSRTTPAASASTTPATALSAVGPWAPTSMPNGGNLFRRDGRNAAKPEFVVNDRGEKQRVLRRGDSMARELATARPELLEAAYGVDLGSYLRAMVVGGKTSARAGRADQHGRFNGRLHHSRHLKHRADRHLAGQERRHVGRRRDDPDGCRRSEVRPAHRRSNAVVEGRVARDHRIDAHLRSVPIHGRIARRPGQGSARAAGRFGQHSHEVARHHRQFTDSRAGSRRASGHGHRR